MTSPSTTRGPTKDRSPGGAASARAVTAVLAAGCGAPLPEPVDVKPNVPLTVCPSAEVTRQDTV